MKPASVRATAPVVRFAIFESFGREDEWLWLWEAVIETGEMVRRRFECATF